MNSISAKPWGLVPAAVLCLGLILPKPVHAAGDWITLQRAKQYQGLTRAQLEQRRHAQILRYLHQHHSKEARNPTVKKMPIPDSRFPESYRALADYYREQAQSQQEPRK